MPNDFNVGNVGKQLIWPRVIQYGLSSAIPNAY